MTQKKDQLLIAGKTYQSRLLVGTGKYKDFEQTRLAIDASALKLLRLRFVAQTLVKMKVSHHYLILYHPIVLLIFPIQQDVIQPMMRCAHFV